MTHATVPANRILWLIVCGLCGARWTDYGFGGLGASHYCKACDRHTGTIKGKAE